MKLKSFIAKPYASVISRKLSKYAQSAVKDQLNWRNYLVKTAAGSIFGKEHGFAEIHNYDDFRKQIPIIDYEKMRPYIEMIKSGSENVLWKGKPLYFAKTSGTTSGVKYIPITKDSIGNHINTARNALLNYMTKSGNSSFADGNMIFLSGSPILERIAGIPTGRLSGIVNHHVPRYLRKNQLPSFETNCIEDWEEKLEKIVDETIQKNMTLISGIPPWVQMYFDWLINKSGAENIKQLFPNLQLLVYGGVNFQPYKKKIFDTIGAQIDTLETYPASEGFIAYQDELENQGLLLNTHSGIFFEFIPVEEYFKPNPQRIDLSEVELGRNYALIINSNAGLWGYSIGDTVKFVSKDPYRIVVTGRIKHFISAFGEHVIAEEVEESIDNITNLYNIDVIEFTVAPEINPDAGLPYHEWFIASSNKPKLSAQFAEDLDLEMRKRNIYYNDLITGNILQPLKINWLPPDTFIKYMKQQGKLGGQNKLPRLSNDRAIAEELLKNQSK